MIWREGEAVENGRPSTVSVLIEPARETVMLTRHKLHLDND